MHDPVTVPPTSPEAGQPLPITPEQSELVDVKEVVEIVVREEDVEVVVVPRIVVVVVPPTVVVVPPQPVTVIEFSKLGPITGHPSQLLPLAQVLVNVPQVLPAVQEKFA